MGVKRFFGEEGFFALLSTVVPACFKREPSGVIGVILSTVVPAKAGTHWHLSLADAAATAWGLAGGSPAATHFLCHAKESKQRKATASRCPSGSRCCSVPSGFQVKIKSNGNGNFKVKNQKQGVCL
jgi:hypothetical protein